jgi:hypothetical protein
LNVALDLLSDISIDDLAQTVGLGNEHVHELATPSDMGFQGTHGCIWEGTVLWTNPITEERQDVRIDTIGLGQSAQGSRKVANLAWIDDANVEACATQGGGDRRLKAAGRLENDGRVFTKRLKSLDQPLDARMVVDHAKTIFDGKDRNIEMRLGDVDAN